jgi:two-component system, OmpR family, sensor kinase
VSAGADPESEVVISVTDDGRGMPPELAAAPFEPARRQRANPGANPGTSGLGLSIAKGIVQAHGGRIELVQPAAAGTCFRVRLPVEAEILDASRIGASR